MRLAPCGGPESATPARFPPIFFCLSHGGVRGGRWRRLARRVARIGARSGCAEGGRISLFRNPTVPPDAFLRSDAPRTAPERMACAAPRRTGKAGEQPGNHEEATMNAERNYLTTREAAQYLGLSSRTLDRYGLSKATVLARERRCSRSGRTRPRPPPRRGRPATSRLAAPRPPSTATPPSRAARSGPRYTSMRTVTLATPPAGRRSALLRLAQRAHGRGRTADRPRGRDPHRLAADARGRRGAEDSRRELYRRAFPGAGGTGPGDHRRRGGVRRGARHAERCLHHPRDRGGQGATEGSTVAVVGRSGTKRGAVVWIATACGASHGTERFLHHSR